MHKGSIHCGHERAAASTVSTVDALFADECHADSPRVIIPRPEFHLVVRFGPSARKGLDVHVLSPRERVTRKTIRRGQWTILARLKLGAVTRVLGAPPSVFTAHVVPLEEVWNAGEALSLYDHLAEATNAADAAAVLERAIAARLSPGDAPQRPSCVVTTAAESLLTSSVSQVAASLGLSERHLRRIFLDTVGLGPKTVARLMRFSRATDLALENTDASWAQIAVAAGFYDQAHLIREFHALADAAPEVFRRELRDAGMLRTTHWAVRSLAAPDRHEQPAKSLRVRQAGYP
jgi:AraC-like DNA-binding protein